MKRQSDSNNRCSHVFPSGRRCRLLAPSADSPFCHRHLPKADPAAELIRDLSEAAGTLSTPEEIHRFLTRVTLLRIQARLAPREACTYAYLCLILQRGQREIAFHQQLRAEHEAEQSRTRSPFEDWHLPRPDRSDPDESPSNATNTSVELSPPAQPVSARASSKSVTPSSEPPIASQGTSSESSTTKLHPDFYNHFLPIDLTLPPGLQDPRKNIPPPDEAECRRLAARRGLPFNNRRLNSPRALR